MALSREQIRAIAIRNSIKRREAAKGETAPVVATQTKGMHPKLLAQCVDAAGFDQHATLASAA